MAVYTPVTENDIDSFLDRYAVGRCRSVAGIAEGVENSNYRLDTESNTFILTIYEKRVDAADLPYFLGLMDHLAARGVRCPVPIKDREGQILQNLAGKPAALISFLEGRSPTRKTATRCASLGQALARLHAAGEGFKLTRRNALSVDDWRPLYEMCRIGKGEVAPDLAKELETELSALESQWPRSLKRGHIHADLFSDNAFFDGDEVTGIIDFYFACSDLEAYDIAICLNAWCFETDSEFNITKARALLDGYRRERDLSTAGTRISTCTLSRCMPEVSFDQAL